MNYLNLLKPHGFLIWRGKQTAIATDELLEDNKYLIASDDEAFGEVSLGKPAAMTIDVFDQQDNHCIKAYERKLLWPEAQSLYVYPIKDFKGFDEPVLFQNGQIANYEPTEDEQRMISQAADLPKTIVLDNEAVCACDKGFDISEIVKEDDNLKRILEAVYETDIANGDGDKSLPIYQLALVRNPKLIVKKKEVSDCSVNIPFVHNGIDNAKDGITTTNAREWIVKEKQMPWEIREEFEDCSGFAVVKIDDDTIAGCHETQEEAEAQMTALVLSEEEENASDEPEEEKQEELEIAEGFAIIDTTTGDVISCHPTQEAAEEQLEELLMPEEEMEEKAGKRLNAAMLKRLRDAWQTLKDMISWGEYKEDKHFLNSGYGIAIKEVNGKPWIITWSSNAFEDRDKEIISTKALEKWSEEVNKRDDKGFFNLWHIGIKDDPGLTDFARKEWTGVPGRMLVEAGPFLDNEKGQKALEFFEQYPKGHPEIAPEGWGCSIEFKFLPEEREQGVFENVEITRTSVLPRFAAANIHTQVKEVKAMSMTDEQKEAALVVFGKELGTTLIGDAENKSKELEENVAHKENDEQQAEDGPTIEFQLDEPSLDELAKTVIEPVAEILSKQFDTNNQPIVEALTELAIGMKALKEKQEQMGKQEEIKQETEMPRFTFQAVRASQSDKTKVADDDDIANQKPKETNKKEQSVSGSFFTGGK